MSTSLVLQINAIVLFVAIFINVYEERISSSQLVLLAEFSTFFGYCTWMAYVRFRGDAFRYQGSHLNYVLLKQHVGKQTAKSGIIFIMILLAISPILKTLTEDISSDSIWTMSVFCFIINLCFNDYRMTEPWRGKDASAIALNAAIWASVILASRLPTNVHVFGLISFAVNWFGLLPIYTRALRVMGRITYFLIDRGILSCSTI